MKYIYPERESKSLDFKSQLPSFSNLIKTCVAFANGLGGKIIIGVEDNREVIGVDDKVRDRIYDEFSNSLYDATHPNLLVEIYEKRFKIIADKYHNARKRFRLRFNSIAGIYNYELA